MPPDREHGKRKAAGVDATNRDFLRYEQVEKAQSYRLAEAEGAEAFDEDFQIRTCDLGAFLRGGTQERLAFARDLHQGLREIGFAILVGHGLDPGLHAAAGQAIQQMFTAHSLEDKLRFRARRHGSVNQGYFPMEETSDIHPDLVEGWVLCRRAFDLQDGRDEPFEAAAFWPDPSLEPVFRRLCQAQEPLIVPIMQAILLGLGCDPHLYDGRLAGTNFALRLNFYPPLEPEQEARGAGRLLGHEDVDLFTLLPAPEMEGLQVMNRASNRWVRLQAPPGSIILNTGDYMQRITNDILPSTTHRVSKPRDPALRRKVRVSCPMNVYLWEDEMLEVLPGLGTPRYAPIRAITFHTRTTAKYYGDDHAVSG